MFLSSRARPVRRADNITANREPDCLNNVGSLTSHNPIGLHGLLRRWLYFTSALLLFIRINSDYFLKMRQQICLCNEYTLCSL
jgi:hypothetical protein